MSVGPEIVEWQPALVSTRGDGAGVIKRGIDLLRRPELNKSIAFTETCSTCGGPLTQGECLRCLVSLGFLSDSQQPHKFVILTSRVSVTTANKRVNVFTLWNWSRAKRLRPRCGERAQCRSRWHSK